MAGSPLGVYCWCPRGPPRPPQVLRSPSGWKVSSRHSVTWPCVATSRQGRLGWKASDCTTPWPTGRLSASEPWGDTGGQGGSGVSPNPHPGTLPHLQQVPEVDVAVLGGAAHVRVLLVQDAVQPVGGAAVTRVPGGGHGVSRGSPKAPQSAGTGLGGSLLAQQLPGVLVQQPQRGVQAGSQHTLPVLAEAHAGDGAWGAHGEFGGVPRSPPSVESPPRPSRRPHSLPM